MKNLLTFLFLLITTTILFGSSAKVIEIKSNYSGSNYYDEDIAIATATPASQSICSGVDINTILLTSNENGTNFSWTRDNAASVTGIANSGTGNISGSLTNSTNLPVKVTFTISHITFGVPGAPITAFVVVSPMVTMDVVQNVQICSGGQTDPINFTGSVYKTKFKWTNDNPAIGLAANGKGNIPSFIAINNTNTPLTANITVTPEVDANGSTFITGYTGVKRLNLSTGVIDNISSLASYPWGFTFNDEKTKAYYARGSKIEEVDIKSGVVLRTISLAINGFFKGISISKDGQKIYLANPGTGSLLIINANNGIITNTIPVNNQIQNLLLSPDGSKLFITATAGNGVTVMNTVTETIIASISGTTGAEAMILHPDGDKIVICIYSEGLRKLKYIDINTMEIVHIHNFPQSSEEMLGFCMNDEGTKIYFCSYQSSGIRKLYSYHLNSKIYTASPSLIGGDISRSIQYVSSRNEIHVLIAGKLHIFDNGTLLLKYSSPSYGAEADATSNFVHFEQCPGQSQTFTITVQPNFTSSVVADPNPAFTGENIQLTADGGSDYSWTGPNAFSSAIADPVINNVQLVNDGMYHVSVLDEEGCIGEGTLDLSVSTAPNVIATPITQVICSGSEIESITFTSANPETTFSWARDHESDVTGIASFGFGNISASLTNTTSTEIMVKFTITPIIGNFSGVPVIVKVVVKPLLTVDEINDLQPCNGQSTEPIEVSGSAQGTTFKWTNDNPSIGLSSGGSGDIPAFTATNNTNAPITANITVTPVIPRKMYAYLPSYPYVKRVDLSDNSIENITDMDGEPWGFAINNAKTKAYFIRRENGNKLIEIDVRTGEVLRTLPLNNSENLRSICLSKDDQKVYVVDFYLNGLQVMDLNTGQLLSNINIGYQPQNLLLSPDGSKLFVTCSDAGVYVVNTATNSVTNIPLPGYAEGLLLHPDGDKIVVGCLVSHKIHFIDINSYAVTASYTMNISTNLVGICLNDDGSEIYFTGKPPSTGDYRLVSYNFATGITKFSTKIILINNIRSIQHVGITNEIYVMVGYSISIYNSDNLQFKSITGDVNGYIEATSNFIFTEECFGQPETFTITVQPDFITNVTASPNPAFAGADVQLHVDGGTTYNWSGPNNFTSGISDPVIIDAQDNNNGLYSVTVTDVNGCTGHGSTEVSIIDLPTVVVSPVKQQICDSEVIEPIIFTGNLPEVTFSWTRDHVSDVTGIDAFGFENISGTLNNTTNQPITVTFTITPIFGQFSGTPVIATVLVQPTVTIDQIDDQQICNDALTENIIFSGSVPGTVFEWTNSNPSIGLPATGRGAIAPFTALNPDTTPHIATITATPVATRSIAYIANQGPNTVSVIDLATNTVLTSIPVGDGPWGVSVSADGTRVYVAHDDDDKVYVISTASNTVIHMINVGDAPVGLSVNPDGSRVYVANAISKNVSVINTATNTVIATIPVGSSPRGVCVSPDGTKVYVANYFSNSVSVIDAVTNTVVATVPVGTNPNGITLSSDGSKIYVTNFNSANVSVINSATNTVINTIGVGLSPFGISLHPDGSKLFVSNHFSNNVSVINTLTNTVLTTIAVGVYPMGVSVSPDGSKVFVVNNFSNNVSVINTATNTVINTIPVEAYPLSQGNFIAQVPDYTCPGTPETFMITVKSSPVGSASPQTICSGSAGNIDLNSSLAGTTYSWTATVQIAPTGGTITGFSDCTQNCGSVLAQTLTNSGTSSGTVRYTVTPFVDGCNGTPFTVDVTVDVCCPTIPTVTLNPSAPVCAGENVVITASGLTTMNPNNYGITFKYFNASTTNPYTGGTVIATIPNGNLTGGGAGATFNTNILPPGNNYIYAILSPTPFDINCRPAAFANITVHPIPTVLATPSSQAICSATSISTIVLSGPVNGSTYIWTRDNTASVTGIAGSGSGNISGTLNNTTNAPITVTFAVTPSANGCTGIPVAVTITVNPTPVAIVSADTDIICVGEILHLTASGGSSYNWSGPSGFTSVKQNPDLMISDISMGGIYSVTVTSAHGCNSSGSVSIAVNPLPVGTISVASNPACVGSMAQLSATGGITYNWSGPKGWTSNLQNPSFPVINYLQGGKYSVTITNASGCSVVLSSVLKVLYPPVALATYEGISACKGSDLRLHGSGAGSYTWSGPNGFTSTLKDPVVTNAGDANSGLYTLVVTSPNGCTSSSVINVIINTSPVLTANPQMTKTCEGSQIHLTATGSGIFSWSGPATYTSDQQNPVIYNITSQMSGIYTVQLTAASGCVSSASVEIQVFSQVIVKASAPDTICQGQSLQLHAEGGSTYLWSGPAGFNSTEADPRIDNITLAQAGKYYVHVYNEGGCFNYSELNIMVLPSAKATASVNSNPVKEFNPVQFSASLGISYKWSGPLGFSSTEQNPSIKKVTRYMAGVYSVTITNENGCPSVAKVTLKVNYTNKGENTFTGAEGDELSIRSEKTDKVYPNPTTDFLYFETQSSEAIEYIIFDINGNVKAQLHSTGDKYISTDHLESGIYHIRWKARGQIDWIDNRFVKIR